MKYRNKTGLILIDRRYNFVTKAADSAIDRISLNLF